MTTAIFVLSARINHFLVATCTSAPAHTRTAPSTPMSSLAESMEGGSSGKKRGGRASVGQLGGAVDDDMYRAAINIERGFQKDPSLIIRVSHLLDQGKLSGKGETNEDGTLLCRHHAANGSCCARKGGRPSCPTSSRGSRPTPRSISRRASVARRGVAGSESGRSPLFHRLWGRRPPFSNGRRGATSTWARGRRASRSCRARAARASSRTSPFAAPTAWSPTRQLKSSSRAIVWKDGWRPPRLGEGGPALNSPMPKAAVRWPHTPKGAAAPRRRTVWRADGGTGRGAAEDRDQVGSGSGCLGSYESRSGEAQEPVSSGRCCNGKAAARPKEQTAGTRGNRHSCLTAGLALWAAWRAPPGTGRRHCTQRDLPNEPDAEGGGRSGVEAHRAIALCVQGMYGHPEKARQRLAAPEKAMHVGAAALASRTRAPSEARHYDTACLRPSSIVSATSASDAHWVGTGGAGSQHGA